MFRRIVAAALIAASLATPAWAKGHHAHHAARAPAPIAAKVDAPKVDADADLTPEQSVVVMMGSAIHAESLCDVSFTTREGYGIIKSKVVGKFDAAEVVPLMFRGVKNFDGFAQIMGKEAACASMNHYLAGVES